jgi:hypothetical protein
VSTNRFAMMINRKAATEMIVVQELTPEIVKLLPPPPIETMLEPCQDLPQTDRVLFMRTGRVIQIPGGTMIRIYQEQT